MTDKRNKRDYYREFQGSPWGSAGNDSENEQEVYQEFEEKFQKVKSKAGISREFLNQLKKMWDYLRSGEDLTVKAMIIGGLFYFISPIDLVPDFIPLAGLLDDAAVIAGIWAAVSGAVDEFRKRS